MNLAVLRVEGDDAALNRIGALLPAQVDATWKKGDLARSGKCHGLSGIGATIADAANPGELCGAVREFVAQCAQRGLDFSEAGVSAELDMGITVGDSTQFVAGVDFSPNELSLFARLGLSLSVTAYPTSD